MVLAAGIGSRLKPFTNAVPKPLMPVQGIPCIEFALLQLKSAGVSDVIANVHAHADQMKAYFQSHPIPGMSIAESNEEALLLGSAGGFRKALPFFDGAPFFSMNADVIHLASLDQLASAHERLRQTYGVVMTMVLAKGSAVESQTGEYREIHVDPASGLIKGFGEKKKRVPFYTGTAIFESEAFSHLPVDRPSEFVPDVLEPMIKAGRVGFIESDALFIDIGSPELWAQAQLRLRHELTQNSLPPHLVERLKKADPTLGGRFELGKNKIRLQDIEYEIKDLRYL